MLKNKPEIRFDGFDDEWEQWELGKIGTLKNGMNFDKNAMGHGYPFINLLDVFGTNIVKSEKLGLATSSEKQRNDYNLLKNDVLFIRSSVKPEGVGEAAVVVEDIPNTTYSGFMIRFRPNMELNINFERYIFSTDSVRNQIMKGATSSANTNINQVTLSSILAAYPNINEQTIIGNLFCNLDNIITQKKQQCEQTVNIKKAMLEKMFPKKGENVPEIRFDGFSGEWEEGKYKNVCEFVNGRAYCQSELLSDGKYKILRLGNLFTSENWYYSDLELPEKQYCSYGDLLYAWSASFGPTVWLGDKVSYHYHIWKVIYRDCIDKLFLYYVFNYDVKNITNELQGGTMSHLTKNAMELRIIFYPTLAEQTAIGKFFRSLDTLIEAQQEELEKLQNIKKALLNKMLL